MINFSTFLLESRLDFLKQQHSQIDSSHDSLAVHRSASDIIDHFATHADPSKNKANTQWIINRYKERDFRQEDHGRIRSALEDFQKHKSKLAKKDINQYRSLSDLEDAVEPHLGTVSRKQEKVQIKHEGADLIHNGPEFMVHRLKTKEAACHYGKGTKWCTAADKGNRFDHYNTQGPLYVVTHKPSQEKHQFHFETNQFMDAKDKSIDLHKFVSENPELKEVKEFRERSPYFGRNEKESQHIIKWALDDPNEYVRESAIKHPNATVEHIDKALEDPSPDVRLAAIKHPNVTVENIDRALDDSNIYVRLAAFKHPNTTLEHIDKALRDPSEYVREEAIQHPKTTAEHISKALTDPDNDVKEAAIRHPKATAAHIDKALNDPAWNIREAAIHHPNATAENISKALEDPEYSVRYAAIKHPSATEAHIDKALDDPHTGVRYAAIKHPSATEAHIDKALDDPSPDVQRAAQKARKNS